MEAEALEQAEGLQQAVMVGQARRQQEQVAAQGQQRWLGMGHRQAAAAQRAGMAIAQQETSVGNRARAGAGAQWEAPVGQQWTAMGAATGHKWGRQAAVAQGGQQAATQ